jgi:putative SOS response-associated peptidase YedK
MIMCGRFTLDPTTKFEERFKVSNRLEKRSARYNIAPTQDVPVIVRNSPNRIMMMRWGLIPYWAKDESIGYNRSSFRKCLASFDNICQ